MRRLFYILTVLLLSTLLQAREYQDTAIWQGWNLKLDLGTPVLELARSKGKVMSFEGAVNFNLQQRFYPTVEFGYGQGTASAAGGDYFGRGGYGRVGLDLSALRKSRKDNMLLVGVRLGTAVQGYRMDNVLVNDPYWGNYTQRDFVRTVRADVWGEVVGGVQVKVYGPFHMGWYARLRFLFTRKEDGNPTAYYIPGYGYRDLLTFGLNYYIGLKF